MDPMDAALATGETAPAPQPPEAAPAPAQPERSAFPILDDYFSQFDGDVFFPDAVLRSLQPTGDVLRSLGRAEILPARPAFATYFKRTTQAVQRYRNQQQRRSYG